MTNGEIRSGFALTSTWFCFDIRHSAFTDSQGRLGRDAENEAA